MGITIGQATVAKCLGRRGGTPPSHTWRASRSNHVAQLASVDFFTVLTATFRVLFVFVVLSHDRRRILHLHVTAHPTSTWTAQQPREAWPWDSAPRVGKQAILESTRAGLQAVRYVAFSIDGFEAFTSREFGVARGGYRYSFVRIGSSQRHDRVGKFLSVFRRQPDGSWKFYRDCFNLDAPAPSPSD